MKKVGILTFHSSLNYGAYMQAYALSTRIANDFDVNVEVINYEMPVVQNYYKRGANSWKRIVKNGILANYKLRVRNKTFKNELSNLPLSNHAIVTDEYRSFFSKISGKYDVIVVGSDAVWNWNVRGFPNAYLLGEELKGNKMSYAASSHGFKFKEISQEQREYLKRAWGSYKYIGVRDSATEAFVHYVDNTLCPIHNCDPTILLEMDKIPVSLEHLEQKLKRHGVDVKKPIIGIMGGENIGKLVRSIYGKKYQLVALYQPNRFADYYLYDLTPFEWAKVFSLFKMTFTSYFHGTLLSLKNGTPNISIDSWLDYALEYEPKMKDILSRLGLRSTYFFASEITPQVIENIKSLADGYFIDPPKDKIKNAIAIEESSYSGFSSALRQLIS